MENIKYRKYGKKRDYSISVDRLLKRFSKSKECEDHTKYRYPFETCLMRFLFRNIKGIQNLSEGQMSFLKSRFDEQLDRAVNVYHLRRMKVSSANQVHEIDSFWC